MQSDANPVPTAHEAAPVQTDVLIVGAGPVGLFAAFEAGVIGLSCQIVDSLARVGGQCIELYPDKPIYDIPAIPSCTARELVERLMQQCHPFDVPIHLDQRVMEVTQRDDGRWTVRTATRHGVRRRRDPARGRQRRVSAATPVASRGRVAGRAPRVLQRREARRFRRQERGRRGRRRLRARLGTRASQRREASDAGASSQWFQRDGVVGRRHEARGRGRRDGLRRRDDRADSNAPEGALRSVAVKQVEGSAELAADMLVVLYGLVADLGPIANWGLRYPRRARRCRYVELRVARGRASSRSATSPTIRTSRS